MYGIKFLVINKYEKKITTYLFAFLLFFSGYKTFAQTLRGVQNIGGMEGGTYRYTIINWSCDYTIIKKNQEFYIKLSNVKTIAANNSLYGTYTKADLGLSVWPNADHDPFNLHLTYTLKLPDGSTKSPQYAVNNEKINIASLSEWKGANESSFKVISVEKMEYNGGSVYELNQLIGAKKLKSNSTKIEKAAEGGKTETSSSSTGAVASAGKSFEKSSGSSAATTQKPNQSDFWNDKNTNTKTTTGNQPAAKQGQPTATEIMADVQKKQSDFWNDKKESDTKIEQQTANRIKNINDASAAKEARDNLNESTSLRETYATVEQLMQDFNYKMSQINSQVNTLTANNKAEFNSRVDNSFSDPKDAGLAAGVKLIGAIVNDAKEKKEREYYKEKLEKEKNAQLKEIANTKRKMLTNVRQQLFAEIKEGSLPLSSSALKANTIYYFIFSYDPARLSYESPVMYISNAFPINKYSDDTWPFKSNIISETANLTPFEEKLTGYYLSEREANAMINAMVDIFKKTGGIVEAINYKGKPASSAGKSNEDFWEREKKPIKTEDKKPAETKKSDFWNN